MAADILREWVRLSEALKREVDEVRDRGFAQRRALQRLLAGEWPYRYLDADGNSHENDLPAEFWDQADLKWDEDLGELPESAVAVWGNAGLRVTHSRPGVEAYRIEVLVPPRRTSAIPKTALPPVPKRGKKRIKAKAPVKIGRPSSKDLVRAEAERRMREELALIPDLLKTWGDELAAWLAKQPGATPVAGKTVEGYVRDLHRKAKSQKVIKSGK